MVGLDCEKIHTADAVPSGRALFGGSGETVESRDDARGLETCGRERRNELCFQQSASDSTGPEIDVAQRAVGQGLADHDVCNLYAAARFEDPADLRNRPV